MSDIVNVGLLTDHVVSFFGDDLLPVGDGVAPAEGGWRLGQPNVDVFVPYAVVSSAGVTRSLTELCSNGRTWDCQFSLRYHGGSRKQADWAATSGRRQFDKVCVSDFAEDAVRWRVFGLSWSSLGGVQRVDQTDPPFWSVQDVAVLRVGLA